MNFPYWLEATMVVILFVGGFLFVIYKDNGNLRIIPEAFKGFFLRLRDMFLYNIEDRETYERLKKEKEEEERKNAGNTHGNG